MTLNGIHLHKTELGFQIKVFVCTVAYRLWARGLIGPNFRPSKMDGFMTCSLK